MPTSTAAPAVLVTGTSRGLGAVTARHLARHGYQVFAGRRDLTPGNGDDATNWPAGTGNDPAVVPVQLDVTDHASVDGAVRTVTEHLSGRGLFAVVNNAAVLHAGPLERTSDALVEASLRTNVAGPLAVTRAFLPLLRRGQGRVINVGSVNAFLPLPYWGLYSATKAALVALSDALRLELAPSGVGVTVLTLAAFATDVRARAQAAWAASAGGGYDEARATNGALVAMLDAGAGDPELVADALLGILRDEHPPARVALGDGIDDLLVLASRPVEERDAALRQLLEVASSTPLGHPVG